MNNEILLGGVLLAALSVGLLVVFGRRQRRLGLATAHELHRELLLVLVEAAQFMPGMDAREIQAARQWLHSRRRWNKPIPYDQGVRLRRVLRAIAPEQRRRALLEALEGPCVRHVDRALGDFPEDQGPVVEQVMAWLESDPLDAEIGRALAEAGCTVRGRK